MIQLIVGKEGKGKTAFMLDRVNQEIKDAKGNIVYIDKNAKHMYELNNKIRLVDVSEFDFSDVDEFYGFICGIISQDHDLEQLYFDNFKRIANINTEGIAAALTKFSALSEKTKISFCISVAEDKENIPEQFQKDIIVAL